LSETTGEPVPICVQDFLGQRARAIRLLAEQRRTTR
jgi:hypothetical protein